MSGRWRAVNRRPFTHHVRRHAQALEDTLERSSEHADLAALHNDVARMWDDYRKTSKVRFGDFGLMYQSCTPAYLPGSRDTDLRSHIYDLSDLAADARVLDLGCNTGFLTLEAARTARHVTGLEVHQPLVSIAERVAQYLDSRNCSFVAANATAFEPSESFDLVIAAAVHGWFDLPFAELANRLAQLVSPGGSLLFESQGRRSTVRIEENFAEKVASLTEAGFQTIRDGTLCDDGVNKRAFVVLERL